MKHIVAALTALLLLTTPVLAASEPPPGLAGTVTITVKDATTVTLHAEQTGGTEVRLILEHYCYDESGPEPVYAGVERVGFTGAVDATFLIGPRTYHGKTVVPTDCWAFVTFNYSSSRAVVLDVVYTLP